ncbi:MAG: indole-3-glycerol phosphate synthase TrpC [Candidatus Margulisiibacteriota bacterium]
MELSSEKCITIARQVKQHTYKIVALSAILRYIIPMLLDEIVQNKRQEVTGLKIPSSIEGLPKTRPFLSKDKFSLIAEIKKASPSAGLIRPNFDPYSIAKAYEESGAAAISVLTDEKYFQGKLEYIKQVKEITTIPVLRKDFILNEAQVYESRIAGADAILLIVRILSEAELSKLISLTEQLGMQALVETHTAEEAKLAVKVGAKIIGINNRDLDTLKIDLRNTLAILKQVPELKDKIVISESGIKTNRDIQLLKNVGVNGVLIGETILKSDNIPAKIEELML